jgi:hypothetical protein
LINIKEFHQSFSSPKCFFLIFVINYSVSSSDILSKEGMLNIHFVFIRTSCIETEINDGKIVVFNMLIGNFFDGIGVLGDNLIDLLRIGDYLFHLSNSRELFFFLCSFDWISEILLLRIVLIGLFLHDMFFSK